MIECGVSDHDRHKREIQAVGCNLALTQDHTFDILKNYRRNGPNGTRAAGAWDCAVETGEIAAACLVPSTGNKEFAHVAKQIAMRPNVIPDPVMVSDTWPKSEDFWLSIFPKLRGGRLGLFHFMNRIIKTLRESHTDYASAVRELQFCCYSYHPVDKNNLYRALKDGSFNNKNILRKRSQK